MSRRVVAGSLFALTAVFLLLQLVWLKTDAPVFIPGDVPIEAPREEPPNLGHGPRNSTLGFQKIFYIGLPQRTDRRDMMTLMAGYLNLDFTPMDGVNGSQIAPKAYPWDVRNPPPPAPGHALPNPNAVGCWRAHSNVWSHIISSGITSALILEDDVDFSIGIRDIMEGISQQLQSITGAKNEAPYGIVDGNSWDLLALGSCGNQMADSEKHPEMFRVWTDPYVPEGNKRILGLSRGWACTHGYAVTREGAMRLLYNIGGPGRGLDQPMDLLLFDQMRRGLLKSFVATPNIISQWKVADWRDTDIQPASEQQFGRKGSESSIIRSVREEIKKVFGSRNIWEELEKGGKETTKEESGGASTAEA